MIHFRFIVPRKKGKKKYIFSRATFESFMRLSEWTFFFSFDVAFLVSRKKKKKREKYEKMNLIVASSIGRKKKKKKKIIVPRSAINYVLFCKSNQGHPDDKRCNKYTFI